MKKVWIPPRSTGSPEPPCPWSWRPPIARRSGSRELPDRGDASAAGLHASKPATGSPASPDRTAESACHSERRQSRDARACTRRSRRVAPPRFFRLRRGFFEGLDKRPAACPRPGRVGGHLAGLILQDVRETSRGDWLTRQSSP